jgi:glycosyltransferase involved in cell wall biosynthesis
VQKKVSIIIPCFNAQKFIYRCLDSILNQTYKNIELILVNDGSVDKTEEVIYSYIEKLKKLRIDVIYIYQNHKNQAAAMNKGLKIFSGDYLSWMDCDDFISIDSIEKKVKFLEENKQYGMVRTSAYVYREENLEVPVRELGKDKNYGEDIFKGLISGEVGCSNGRYMIRRSAFLDINPKREIYESNGGQNWQILIPIAYKYKCGYLDEYLFNCVIRKESHSRQHINKSKNKELERIDELEDMLTNTLDKVFGRTYNEYYKLVKIKYTKERIRIGRKYKDINLREEQNKILMDLIK